MDANTSVRKRRTCGAATRHTFCVKCDVSCPSTFPCTFHSSSRDYNCASIDPEQRKMAKSVADGPARPAKADIDFDRQVNVPSPALPLNAKDVNLNQSIKPLTNTVIDRLACLQVSRGRTAAGRAEKRLPCPVGRVHRLEERSPAQKQPEFPGASCQRDGHPQRPSATPLISPLPTLSLPCPSPDCSM